LEIELPDGTVLDAPDDADPSAVARAYMAKQATPQDQPPAQPQAPSVLDQLKRQLGLTARVGADLVGSAPLLAMDAGVATRNLLDSVRAGHGRGAAPNQEPPYEMPSKMYSDALDQFLPRPQTGIEKGVNIAGQVLLGSKLPGPSIANPAPAGFNPALVKDGQPAMQQFALQKARQQGYAVPPSTVNPSPLNKTLESIGGKVATQQDASLGNQQITDALVKSDLGLSKSTAMSEAVLPSIRSAAGEPYEALRKVGTMRADTQYSDALTKITSKYQGAAKDFPDLARNDIMDAVESVRKPSFDSESAIDAISILRDKAATSYRQGDKALGKAYREISSALEEAMERSLSRRGNDSTKLLEQFRSARQLIAKTYSAEAALNPQVGSFNAQKLAAQLAKGKPLSGDMKKAAEFAQAFPKASQLILDSGSVRNTDIIMGAGTAMLSKEPTYLLYPFARQAARAGLLSNAGQSMLTQPGVQPMPQTAMGLLYGTQGLLNQ
jgi:hypothetical protein